MHRVGDNAVQAGGVEDALVEVEIPRAVLLGHQAPLQAVGQPADHALQMRQLLVEMGAQAGQLVGVAQIGGLDDLVVAEGADRHARAIVVLQPLIDGPADCPPSAPMAQI